MAGISGTSGQDFIHRLGDGLGVPGGFNEITGVTLGADSISGGLGGDLIYADNGNDTVNGDDGFDTLYGGQGADQLLGGNGNDVFRLLQISDISGLAETVNGGNDIDTLDFQSSGATGAVDLSAATLISVEVLLATQNDIILKSAQLDGFTSILGTFAQERLFLSDGGLVDLTGATINSIEEIRGNALANQINLTGVAIGQFVNTLGGDDSVLGGLGADFLDAGTGNDTLAGDAGADSLVAGDGNDVVAGGNGNDVINGGVGTDSLVGGAGNDVFRVTFVGDISGLAETVDGGTDIDALDFQSEAAGGAVNLANATLIDIETLLLGGTEVTLKAAQLGAFTTISGSFATDRVILTGGGVADLTGASISAIEEIRGSAVADKIVLTDVFTGQFVDARGGADQVLGSLGADIIKGGLGNDAINGADGADTLIGGQGADNVQGGLGNDLIQIAGISDVSALAETINGGADVDTLDFQGFGAVGRIDLTAATIVGIENLQIGNNQVKLTAAQMSGFEGIFGNFAYDRLELAAAGVVNLTNANIAGIDEFRGTVGGDTFLFAGAAGSFLINTLDGADSVQGGDGNETLQGGSGNDTLGGGAGADWLYGQLGTDSLTGGAAGDAFVFDDLSEMGLGAARDVITDFVHGQDIIRLTNVDANVDAVGDQNFIFIGSAAFSGAAGEVRYAGGVLQGNVDAGTAADFEIRILGAPVITLTDLQL